MKNGFPIVIPPLVLFAIFIAAGILFGWYCDSPLVPLAVCAVFFAPAVFFAHRRKIPWTPIVVLIAGGCFLVGVFRMAPYRDDADWLVIPDENRRGIVSEITGRVCRFPDYRGERAKLLLNDVHAGGELPDLPPGGKLLLTLPVSDDLPRYGDVIRLKALLRNPDGYKNPGGFNYREFLRFQNVRGTAYPVGKASPEILRRNEGAWVLLKIGGVRDSIRSYLDERYAWQEREVLKALIIGEKHGIPEEMQEVYRRTGVAHILAISGFHVGVVAGISYVLFWFLLTRWERLVLFLHVRKVAAALTFIPLIFYVLLAGWAVSTVRAGIMIGAFLLAILIDRDRDLASAVALAAFLILLFYPPALFGASFQLSFAAVIGIFLMLWWLYQRREEQALTWVARIKRILADYFWITIAAGLATMPFMAFTFHRVSFLGFAVNPFFTPIIGGIAIPLALLGTIFLAISDSLASGFFTIALYLLHGAGYVLQRVSDIPGSWFFVPAPRWWELVCVYLTLLSLPVAFWKRKVASSLFILSLSCLLFSVLVMEWRKAPEADYRITFLDVGQGDSMLLELGGGEHRTILIDGGGVQKGSFDVGQAVVAPYLWHKRIRKLDAVVLTHPHPDHFGGLKFICEHFQVEEFWWNGLVSNDPRFRELMDVLDQRKIPKRFLSEGPVNPDVDLPGLVTLFPPKEFYEPGSPLRRWGLNDKSIVLGLHHDQMPVVFSADAETNLEEWLADRFPENLQGGVLKVGHHAGATSASSDFLSAVSPKVAVVTCGRYNPYGVPSRETLTRLRLSGADVYRTDTHGAITIEPASDGLQVHTATGEIPIKEP